ncbi:F-box protein [Aspergillus fumigatus Af293]|uniref:F-box domain protein n=1 Tax=Aspergillus fumigatus (strain ATCC MYA-4609 / CBS 101355 / FGSC A1100 / Af293) TaxID=330879 RepID=Q4WGW3_ASPFU|nr:F-box domain protein [Aspergillus fumigatus Af293]EAL86828.1 F-box domain protein [Aspergillus fumigatus Af293]
MALQALLVPSVQRIISINPPSRVLSESYPTTRTDHFATLPDELLLWIFSLLEADQTPQEIKLAQWSLLTRVSRRWRDVAETLLYRTLLLKDRNPRIVRWWAADKPRLSKLLSTLQKRPHLCYYTRSLQVTVDDDAYSEDILRIMDLLPCVRQVSIQLDLAKNSYLPLVQRVARMKLEELEFVGYGAAPSLNLLFTIMSQMPTLRRLSTYRWGWCRDGSIYTSFAHDDSASITTEELSQLLPVNKQGASPLTSLELHDPKASIEITECFLRWPARLREISLLSLCYGPYESHYDARSIQRLLSIHKDWLQKITLGPIPPQGEDIPDLSDFHRLSDIHVTLYNSSSNERQTPDAIYKKLAAPNLRRLEIDLGNERQPHDQWVAEFLALVRRGRKGFPPQTCVQWVDVKFCRWGDLALGLARRSSINCESVRYHIESL